MKCASSSFLFVLYLCRSTVYSYSIPNRSVLCQRRKSISSATNNKNAALVTTKTSLHSILPPRTATVEASNTNNRIGDRIAIDESFPGLRKIYSNPDVFIIENFLDKPSCQDLINKAQEKDLNLSPVAYAGKSEDKEDLIGLAAKGPVAWLAILTAWYQFQNNGGNDGGGLAQFGIQLVENYALFFILAFASITAFIESRVDGLQSLRTSTSTTLDNLDEPDGGTRRFVFQAANLFNPDSNEKSNPAKHAQFFEAPTVIRYEKDQVLAPHFDANKAASTEDANRGGQTLATLLLYLNDVDNGGNTRFGRLMVENDEALVVKPKMGDALLFFPADEIGTFDDRLEHEGCTAVDTKWIARIWRHIDRVPPPFGLTIGALSKLQ